MLCIYDKEGYWWCAVFYLLLSCIIVTRLWISLHSLIGTHYPHWYILTFTCIVSKYVILVSYYSAGYSFSGQKYYRTKKHGLQKRRVFIKNYCHQFIKIIKFCKKVFHFLRKNNYRINDIGSKLGCYFLYDITFKNE